MKNRMMLLVIGLFLFNAQAESTWTDFRHVGLVYSYTATDTLYVYIDGEKCQNTKDYYTISPEQTSNAKQLISMILTAKASKKKIKIYHEDTLNPSLCYFKGLMIE